MKQNKHPPSDASTTRSSATSSASATRTPPLKLYNTLHRKLEVFTPLHPPNVGFYSCGPTVYNYAHIGNLRTYIFADTLKRVLRYNGYTVTHVMNITDVGHLTDDADAGEDKMEKGSAREGKSVWEIAAFYTEQFKKDLAALNIIEPDIWCKATEHIQDQIEQIKAIEAAGYTYRTSDGIYFDTAKLKDYGALARLKPEDLQAGARVAMGEKKHKTDFALWKFSPKDVKRQMEWDSPWGVGFPGWHIECSAMSSKYLGTQFDIHTGGIDHISVHHPNEIAQAEVAYGTKPWVRYWLHSEFLVLDEGKMAKSGDSFLTLATLTEKGYAPLDYRYFCLGAHYRQQLKFSWTAMDTAKQSRQRLMNIIAELREQAGAPAPAATAYEDAFLAAINDDLNTPKALAVLWKALRDHELSAATKLALVRRFDEVLGLRLLDESPQRIPLEVIQLAEQRLAARKKKDWATSDELRAAIAQRGWRIDDTSDGYKLRRVATSSPSK